VLKRHGEAYRTFRNAVVFLLPDEAQTERMRGAARKLLALEGIAADYGGSERLTSRQEETLADDLDEARSALPQMVYQAYRHIVIPVGKSDDEDEGVEETRAEEEDDELERFDVGLQLYKRGGSLSRLVWDYLADRDKLLERLDPHLLRADRWDLWPDEDEPLQVSQLRDYFARYTQMPMLASEEVLLEAIAQGVELELFGYGQRANESEEFAPLHFGQALPTTQIEVADTAWLVPPAMAKRLTLSSIAGRVASEQGSPMAGVTVRLAPTGESVTTGADGRFAFDGLSSGRYTITPLRSGYTFSPSGRSVTLSGDDVSGLEFVAQEVVGPPETYALSGAIQTADGRPLSDVRVDLEPGAVPPATTGVEGLYAFENLQQGSYTVRPHKSGYTFDPVEITVTLTGDVDGRDFVGEQEVAARGVTIRTEVPWEQWYQFYNDVIDPLMSVGADIAVRLNLSAEADQELGSELIERLRDSVRQYDEDAEVDAG
jgi:hypothetical protein